MDEEADARPGSCALGPAQKTRVVGYVRVVTKRAAAVPVTRLSDSRTPWQHHASAYIRAPITPDVACDVTARTARPARVRRYHGGYPQRRIFEVEPSTSRSYASGRLHFNDGRRGLESLGGWGQGTRLALEREVNRRREVLHPLRANVHTAPDVALAVDFCSLGLDWCISGFGFRFAGVDPAVLERCCATIDSPPLLPLFSLPCQLGGEHLGGARTD